MKNIKSIRLIAPFLIMFSPLLILAQDEFSIASANRIYNQFRLEESRKIYGQIISGNSFKTSEKVTAHQKLAQQDWKLFGNFRNAAAHLQKALALNEEKSKSLQILGQINLEAKRFKEALTIANKAGTESKNETDRINAEMLYAQIIHDQSVDAVKKRSSLDRRKLFDASKRLKNILQEQPGKSAASEMLIGISLLLQDGSAMFDAWKSFYFISNEKNVNQVLVPSYKTFSSVLPKWKNRNLNPREKKSLVIALAESRFYNYAALLGKYQHKNKKNDLSNEPDLKIFYSYQDFIENIGRVNQKFYPEIARGKKKYEKEYDAAIDDAAKILWVQLNSSNKLEDFSRKEFFTEIEKRFGAYGYVGYTVNYYCLLMGHIIHDEQKEINQYGYKAKFRFISLDRSVSQDFTSWYGATNVGGWGTESAIIQVRQSYLREPFRRLGWMIDPAERKKFLQSISDAKAADLIKLRQDSFADPAFLALQLKFNAARQIFDKLQVDGLRGTDLYLAFITENLRLNVESSVFAHEGRHAIDQLFFKPEFDRMTGDERELRAKFSEVIFSSNPKLATTGSIFGANLGEDTAHGKANKRFREIIVDWMDKNRNKVSNLDPAIPLIMQFDLLTDKQIIDICLSADPLNKLRKE